MSAQSGIDLDFSKYGELLSGLLPESSTVALMRPDGQLLWQDERFPADLAAGGLATVIEALSQSESQVPLRLRSDRGSASLFAAAVSGSAGEPKAILWAYVPDDVQSNDVIRKWIGNIAERVAQEVMLNVELDVMAAELGERYEELNLVYHTEDQVNYVGEGWSALNQLVRNCCDYLEVGMAILAVNEKGILIGQQSRERSIPEAKELTDFVQEAIYPVVIEAGNSVVIDDLTEIPADEPWRGMAYRLLATPIYDGKSNAIGVLALASDCRNSTFLNSDKNLLQVMARKVNKILQVSYDRLTGLINRQGLNFVTNQLLQDAQTLDVKHTVLHISIDQHSAVSDGGSEDAGDALLEAIAVYLRKSTRETDVICSLGGNEMVVLLRRCPLAQGADLADKLRQGISELVVPCGDKMLSTTVTIGAAPIESETTSAQAALASAGLACDAAKELGNNRVHLFHHGDARLLKRQLEMETVGSVKAAIRDDRLVLFAQVIEPLGVDKSGFHCEVLVRMNGEDGELVMPGAFIPAAERYHLMPEIDRWVIGRLFDELVRNRDEIRRDVEMISINLSGQTINEQGFAAWLTQKLSDLDYPLERICFEITETAAVANLEEASAFMRSIKAHGCKFALDDFGSGLSSFGYLRSLPIDFLKVDGSIVKEISADPVAASMVAAVQQVASVMSLETVAEFVESEEIKQKLREIGVSFVQGYAVGRPVQLSEQLYAAGRGRTALSA